VQLAFSEQRETRILALLTVDLDCFIDLLRVGTLGLLPTPQAADLVDGNSTMILGLIWSIILRFQIQSIQLEGDAKNATDALLYWCKRVTKGCALLNPPSPPHTHTRTRARARSQRLANIQRYKNVKITNFTTSWKDGLGFNAIIHHFRADLIGYDALNPKKPHETLNNAFDVAEKELEISRLLEPEDVIRCIDEKSVRWLHF
jgi:spectrin beta